MKSDSIKELATALAKAQAKIRHAVKDSANPFFKSKYADLASVWEAVREPLTSNGLAVTQVPDVQDGKSVLVTMLMHSSGEWISGTYPIVPIKNDPQGVGSAITYARRYALQSLAGVCPDDDDGNAASGNTAQPKKVASVTGEAKSKKTEWTADQLKAVGTVHATLKAAGDAETEREISDLWKKMGYDTHADYYAALQELGHKYGVEVANPYA
jgi:hypothetical protein